MSLSAVKFAFRRGSQDTAGRRHGFVRSPFSGETFIVRLFLSHRMRSIEKWFGRGVFLLQRVRFTRAIIVHVPVLAHAFSTCGEAKHFFRLTDGVPTEKLRKCPQCAKEYYPSN